VWRGTDLVLERVVAVKLLRPEYAQDEECLARFRAEGRHAALLSHPNIAQVYDYVEKAPPLAGFLVMELVDGQSLARLLAGGSMDPARTMGIIAQAAGGLRAAHAAGLVHRDIKPGNLLVSRDGHVKITDFGIAQAPGSARVTRTGMLVGTAAYLAPERASGGPATPASDLYSLGVVAYECLTGQAPFGGEPLAVALAHIQQAMPPLPPSVPAAVAALVTDLTAKDPAARPPSAGDVCDRAERWRTAPSRPPAAAPAAPMPAAGPKVPNEPGGQPPGLGNPAGARPRRPRRLSSARAPARAAVVLSAIVLAALGWGLATTHGSAPDHPVSPDTHPAAPSAGSPGAAGPSPAASPSPTGTGSDGAHSRAAPTRAGRRSRSSGSPSPPSPAPSPSASPSLPLPAPSLPLPTPSLSLPV
jgi:serine/threonine-protein kinase